MSEGDSRIPSESVEGDMDLTCWMAGGYVVMMGV